MQSSVAGERQVLYVVSIERDRLAGENGEIEACARIVSAYRGKNVIDNGSGSLPRRQGARIKSHYARKVVAHRIGTRMLALGRLVGHVREHKSTSSPATFRMLKRHTTLQ